MCLHPIPTHRYDSQGRQIYRPCGDCVECSRAETMSWFIRLYEESKVHKYLLFVTYKYASHRLSYQPIKQKCDTSFFGLLRDYVNTHPSKTYNYNLAHPSVFNRYLHPWDFVDETVFVPCFDKHDISAHFKRIRRAYEYKYNENVDLKYFVQGEYGPFTFRPHYHGLIFLDDDVAIVKDLVENDWKKNFGDINNPDESITVKIIDLSSHSDTEKTIEYVAKYVCKPLTEQTPYVQAGFLPKPPRVMSKGIGLNYFDKLNKNNPTLRDEINNVASFEEFKTIWNKYFFYRFISHKQKLIQFLLPRYYRDKLIPRIKVVRHRFMGTKKFVYDGTEYCFDVLSKRLSRFNKKVMKYGHEISKSFSWRKVTVKSYILDYSSKFVRYKDLQLRVLFEESFCRLLNISPDRFYELDSFEMDALYKKYLSLSFKERVQRCKPYSFYSPVRALADECTSATLLAY